MTGESPSPVPRVERGTCHFSVSTDVGFAIDLERAAALLPTGSGRTRIRERRTPSHLAIEPAPLRAIEPIAPVCIGTWRSAPTAELTLFDFGGATLAYRFPLEGPLDALVGLSSALYDNVELAESARRQISGLVDRVGPDPPAMLLRACMKALIAVFCRMESL